MKQSHVESFKTGRKGRNDTIQVLDFTDGEPQTRKAMRVTSTSVVGLGPGSGDPNPYYIQETKLGIWMLWEMTFYGACVPTRGHT